MGKKKKKEERDESFWKLEYAERADSFWKLDDAERKVQIGSLTPRQYGIYLDLRAENTGQPSTSTTAAQFVAIAVPEKDAAVATPVAVAAPEKAAAIVTLTAAQAVAIAAPEEAAAVATPVAIAALEKAAAIATHSGSEDKQTVTDIAAEEATAIASPEEEIERLQLLLIAQQAATVAAITAAEEAAAAAASMKLEVENRRLQLLVAATTARVFVPGYNTPMSSDEHLQALHRQIQYLSEQLRYVHEQHCAAATHAQYWADRCFTAENANAVETATTAISPEPANANDPSREEHSRSQPAAPIAKGNSSTTYAEAVMSSDPSLRPVVKRTARTGPNGRDTARASAAADPEMSLPELRHNHTENAAAAALWTAANAAAAAAKSEDPGILRAVLFAAAATANALAQTSAHAPVQAHRRGGRPPPTRRADPRTRPRRNRRLTGTPAPRATAGSPTTRQSQARQHDPTTNSPPGPTAGQPRPQSGALPPSFNSARSAMLATRKILPLSPTVMRWNIVDRA